ncbi:MAG: Rieske 2Fe-2S domain-containing protein [Polyangiales bacterium]
MSSTPEPFAGYPKGWFVACFSHELAPLAAVPMRYFGRDLVAYRGEDGQPNILDAHCPHLGAHLGFGGKVEGNCVRCPFHAWRFNAEGQCDDVPYSMRIPPMAKVGRWRTREINGVVLVHHDPTGAEPAYEIPIIPEYGTESWLPWVTASYRIRTHPREIVDNLADKAHFAPVHRTAIDEFAFDVDGFVATQRTKGRAFLPGGGVDSFSSTTSYHGPGYLLMRMDGALKNYMLIGHTLVDEQCLDLRLAVTLKVVRDRATTEGFVGQYMANLKAGFEDDIKIWEAKVFRERPVLADGDGPIGNLRRWYRQFYQSTGEAMSAETITG